MPLALGLVETRGLVAAIEAADAMLKAANVTFAGKERTDPAMITIKVTGDVAAVKSSVDAGAAAAQRFGALISTHVIPQPDKQLSILFPEINEKEKPEKKDVKKDALKKESAGASLIKNDVDVKVPKAEEIKKNVEEIKSQIEKESTVSREQETKTLKVEAPRPPEKSKEKSASLFNNEDTISRLRREALGLKKEAPGKQEEEEDNEEESSSAKEIISPKDLPGNLEDLSVPELRRLARSTEGFPIKGRVISKANKQELLSYFNEIR